ncbi:hypothetical protein [Xanthomonas pisi]|uniref:hypothetical protein n=1 Tax=Xanthomonas pisi TaxID=56457 RepID=UPI00138E440B|nr:hypothetical protein [Xanthomonas pisi]
MTIEIVEFRRMLEAGQRYLSGTCSIQELNGHVSCCADAIKFWRGHGAIAQVLVDWGAMIDRRWNERGHSPNPLSEQDFRAWLGQQLMLLVQMPDTSIK